MASPELWGALVLAAGAGERLGGCPKPLITLDGQPLIARLVTALAQAGAHEVVVVLGHHAARIAQAIPAPAVAARIARVVRVEPSAAQPVSLHRGLAALDPRCAAVMVCLADQPLIDAAALRGLRTAYGHRPAGADMVLPWVAGAPGNPVMLSRALAEEWLAQDGALSGQVWRRAHPERVYRWPSDNPAYRIDLDTPADIQALRRSGYAVGLP